MDKRKKIEEETRIEEKKIQEGIMQALLLKEEEERKELEEKNRKEQLELKLKEEIRLEEERIIQEAMIQALLLKDEEERKELEEKNRKEQEELKLKEEIRLEEERIIFTALLLEEEEKRKKEEGRIIMVALFVKQEVEKIIMKALLVKEEEENRIKEGLIIQALLLKEEEKIKKLEEEKNLMEEKLIMQALLLKEKEERKKLEVCTYYMFIEILYNLFENQKCCSIEALKDFLNICEEQEKKSSPEITEILFSEEDFSNLKNTIFINDNKLTNNALFFFKKESFITKLIKKSFIDCDYVSIFKLRYFLFYLHLELKENILDYGKDVEFGINNKISNGNLKENKIYFKNILSYESEIINIKENIGKVKLVHESQFCTDKINILKDIEENYQKEYKNIYIVSSINLNYSENAINLLVKLNSNKILKNILDDNNSDFNDGDSNIFSNSNIKMNLNLFSTDYQKVYKLKSWDVEDPLNIPNVKYLFLLSNNVFLKITDINLKTHYSDKVKENLNGMKRKRSKIFKVKKENDNNNINDNSDIEERENNKKLTEIQYWEINYEFVDFDNLPSEYLKHIQDNKEKLNQVLNLEYEYDNCFFYDILEELEQDDILINYIENKMNKHDENSPYNKYHHSQDLFYLGEAYEKKNNIEKAIELHEKSYVIKKEILTKNHPEYVLSLNNLSSLYYNIGKFEDALKFYLECKDIEEEFLEEMDSANIGITYNNIATVYNKLNNYDQALEYYLKNLDIEKNCFGVKSLEYATALNNIGLVNDNLAKFEIALDYYNKCLSIKEEILEKNNPEIGTSYNNIAVIYDNIGEFRKAIEFYKKSLHIFNQNYASNDINIITVIENI